MYKGICLAVFSEENTKGNITEVATNYISTYGYLAEWRYQRITQKKDLSWITDTMVTNPEDFCIINSIL
jgi:hypothetical protein